MKKYFFGKMIKVLIVCLLFILSACACKRCPPGHRTIYMGEDYMTCEPCPEGSYNVPPYDYCIQCAFTAYNVGTGNTECTDCVVGTPEYEKYCIFF